MSSEEGSVARGATYRDLARITEYRALFAANALSSVGDMLTKVAISVLVFERTGSSLFSAIAFAVSYLPHLFLGPLLSTLADHYPRKTVLVTCDIIRALLVGAVALGVLPIPLMLVLLFMSGLVTFPAWAARSAIVPTIVPGDAYTLAVAVNYSMYQISQIIGFAVGGALVAALSSFGVLAIDAGTFLASAIILATGLHNRPSPVVAEKRGTLAGDTISAIKLLATQLVLRRILLLVWFSSLFAYAHEGLAPALAQSLGGGAATTGLLLGAAPLGTLVAGLLMTRLLTPDLRLRLIPLLAILACAALIPVGFDLPLWAILVCYFFSGSGMILIIPLNATFNRILPQEFRGRAAGIAIAVLTFTQATAIIMSGLLADHIRPGWVVTGSGLIGLLVVNALVIGWPSVKILTTPIHTKELPVDTER